MMKILTYILGIGICWLIACGYGQSQSPVDSQPLEHTHLALLDTTDFNIDSCDDELRRLQIARLQAAVMERWLRYEAFVAGRGTLSLLLASSGRRIVNSRMALATGPWEQLAIRKDYLQFMQAVHELNHARFQAGQIKPQNHELTNYHLLLAELQVLRYPGYPLTERNVPVPPALVEHVRIEAQLPEKDENVVHSLRFAEFVQSPRYVIDLEEPLSSRLPKQLANSAMSELNLRNEEYVTGRGMYEPMVDAAKRVRYWRLSCADSRMKQLEVLTQYRDFLRAVMNQTRVRFYTASVKPEFWAIMNFDLLSAEIDFALHTTPLLELQKLSAPFPPPDHMPNNEPDVFRFGDAEPDRSFIRASGYKIDETEPRLRWMPKDKYNNALIEIASRYREFVVGRGTLDAMFDAARRCLAARLDLLTDPAQRMQARVEYRDFLLRAEKLNQARFDAGAIKRQDLEQTRYERLSAEIELARARGWKCQYP